MKKKIIEITSLEELLEMSTASAVTGYAAPRTPCDKNLEEDNLGAGSVGVVRNSDYYKGKDMRSQIQAETLLREQIRHTIKTELLEKKRQKEQEEHQLRLVIRSLIKEAKETANPHPNTGINKLRDAFRKAKATLKTKYQQLTSTEEQRETFSAHMLRGFVRLFDELDGLQAQGDVDSEVQDIELAVGEAPSLGLDSPNLDLEAPPKDQETDDIEKDLESLAEAILREVIINEADINIVDDEEIPTELKGQLKSGELSKYERIQRAHTAISSKIEDNPDSKDEFIRLYDDIAIRGEDPEGIKKISTYKGFSNTDFGILSDSLENDISPMEKLIKRLQQRKEKEDVDVISGDLDTKEKTQAEKDFQKKKDADKEREEFGKGLKGDATGRNQAYDAFRLVQTYYSDAYLDLDNEEDKKMFRDWCLYNMKLLFQNFEESLPTNPEKPEITDPEGV